nr:Biomphalaria glabrata galactocerebrosidase-like [Biomphalaria glabrata]
MKQHGVSVDCEILSSSNSIFGIRLFCQQSLLPQDDISDVFLRMVMLLIVSNTNKMELKHPTCTIAMMRTMREDMNCGLWLKPKREIKI